MRKRVEAEYLLSNLGVAMNINDNGEITFFDVDNNCNIMQSMQGSQSLPIKTIDDLNKTGVSKYLTSKNKNITFRLNERIINGQSKLYIRELLIETVNHQRNRFEYNYIYFEPSVKHNKVAITSYDKNLYNKKCITIDDNGSIFFELNNRTGLYAKNQFKDDWYLEKQQMALEVQNNELLTIVAEYYGRHFPKLLETVEGAKALARKTYSKTKVNTDKTPLW